MLVTNDKDFAECSGKKIFGVIWLRSPQNDSDGLISAFSNLLEKETAFQGKLITLSKEGFEVVSLRQEKHI